MNKGLWLVYAGVVMPKVKIGKAKLPDSIAFAEVVTAAQIDDAVARACEQGHLMISTVSISDVNMLAKMVHLGFIAAINSTRPDGEKLAPANAEENAA